MSNLADRLGALSPGQRLLLEKQFQKEKSGLLKSHRIPRRTELEDCFLSLDQERLWFIDQLEPGSAAYNLCTSFHLAGRLHVSALERSFDELIERHETLRTTFPAVAGLPRQVIAPVLKMSMERVDLKQLSEAEREENLQSLIVVQGQQPFDLAAGPLLRAALFELSETEHVLVMTMHHIITDKLAHDLLWRELTILYDAFSKGQPSPLAELPIQYADYALWQRQRMQEGPMQAKLAYWKKQLAGASFVFELPADHSRPAVQTYRGKRQFRVQPISRWEGLKALSRRENVTLFMTLLAAFQAWLYRYTEEEDILVGTPFANREMPETEGLIGFLLNMLVLRVDLSGDPSFRQLLRRVRAVALDAYANNDLPLVKLIQELQPERDLSRNPLFQVAFVFVDNHNSVVEQTDLMMTKIEVDGGSSIFDLMLGIRDKEKDSTILFEYSTDLWDEPTIARMLDHFETLLDGILSDPEQRLSELPLLAPAEKIQVLEEWNNTSRCDLPKTCLHRLFEEQAERHPDAIAVQFEEQRLSYAELNARANQVARHLRSMNLRTGALVGIYLERSVEMIVGLLGILKAGGTYLPLTPAYPPARLSYMLTDAGVEVLLTQQCLLATLPDGAPRSLCLDSEWEAIAQRSGENLSGETESEQAAYVIYTSGSTGKPKGVQIPHRAVVNLLASMSRRPGLSETDTLLAVTSLSFDIAVLELLLPLVSGARLVIADSEAVADAQRLMALLAACGATIMQATPATWRMLIGAGWQGQSGLQILCGGEALARDLADQLLHRGTALWNLYGPTETTIWSAIDKVSGGDQLPSLGRGIANTQLYVLDQHLHPVPVGVPGELHIGGAGLAHGYLNRPELTAEKFIPNAFSKDPGDRLFRTGDRVRIASDGNLEFQGRLDRQVKLRGFRIELGEVEAALNSHSSIRENVVIIRDDGAGNERLIAYVVTEPSPEELTSNELRRFLEEKLPAFMIPSAFITLDELPLTQNGKVDRKVLPAPGDQELPKEKGHVAPQTVVEQRLVEIWSEVMKLEKIGAADNFFDLGGHSLMATQIISRVRECFQTELTLRQFFASPTVAGLAQHVEAGISAGKSANEFAIVPVTRVARHKMPPRS